MTSEENKDHLSLEVFEEWKGKIPNLCFIIERSKNKNIVCYEAQLDAGDAGKLDAAAPIVVYWMDIDPEYVKKARASGKTDDKNPLNMMENQFAYGVSSKPTDVEGEYKLALVALPKQDVTAVMTDEGPKTKTLINGRECYMVKVYVSTKEGWIKPTVLWVDIIGFDVETGELQVERHLP